MMLVTVYTYWLEDYPSYGLIEQKKSIYNQSIAKKSFGMI